MDRITIIKINLCLQWLFSHLTTSQLYELRSGSELSPRTYRQLHVLAQDEIFQKTLLEIIEEYTGEGF